MWGSTMDLCCHLFFLHYVVDVVTELAGRGVLIELLYADDLVVMNETVQRLGNKLLKFYMHKM